MHEIARMLICSARRASQKISMPGIIESLRIVTPIKFIARAAHSRAATRPRDFSGSSISRAPT